MPAEFPQEGGPGGEVADASTTVKGVVKLSTAPAAPTNPIAAGTNDPRLSDARTPTAHTHPQADVTGLTGALAAKADLVAGTVPTAQLPAIAITSVQVVASQAAQLALVTQEGDVVVRSDESKTYVRNAGTSGTMADFTLLNTPTDLVLSVNGQTGTVVLGAADVGAASTGALTTHEGDTTNVHGIADTTKVPQYTGLAGDAQKTFSAKDGTLLSVESGGAIDWAASTAYTVGQLVTYAGTVYRVITAHTSTSTFDATKFAAVSSSLAVGAVGALRKGIASRCMVNQQNGGIAGTAAGETLSQDHKCLANCDGLRVAYSNTFGGGRSANTTSIFVRAALLDVTGGVHQVTFNGGSTEVEIKPGVTVISDMVGIGLSNGDRFKSRTYVRVAVDGQLVPNGANTRSSPYVDGVLAGDQTTATSPAFATDSNYHFGPAGIFADFTDATSVIAVVGDSISAGQNDGNSNYDQIGWQLRGLANQYPYVHVAIAGDSALAFKPPTSGAAATSRKPRVALLDGCTHAICLYGANELSQPVATTQDSLLRVWRSLAVRGMRVVAATITPITTSTDGFTTLGNQTVNANDANRVALNTWIRGGAPIDPTTKAPVAVGTSGALVFGSIGHPAVAFLETAGAVESSLNSGKWSVSGGAITDGTHPNAAGSALMAATITAAIAAGTLGTPAPGATTPPPSVDPATVLGSQMFARYAASMEVGKSDGDALSQLTDQSGNARHLTQGTAGKRPLYKTNINYSLPAYRFDGTDDFVAADYGAGSQIAQQWSVFIIGKMRSGPGGANKHLFGFASSSGYANWGAGSGIPNLHAGTNLAASASTTTFSDAFHMWEWNGNSTSSQIRKDNTQQVSGNAGTNPLRYMSLGCDNVGNFPADIDIQECIVVSGSLTSQQRSDLRAYAAATYATP